MTKLILDPTSLPLVFPKASVSKLYKVRLLVQVLHYDLDEICLVVQQAPIGVTSSTLSIDVSNIVSSLTPEIIHYGSMVNITGFYDGNRVTASECCLVDGNDINNDTISTLVAMTNLEPFE